MTALLRIMDIKKNSFAEREGLSRGDVILEINGKEVVDLIDLHYHSSDPPVEIRVRRKNGKVRKVLYPGNDVPLGIVPEPVRVKICRNKCVFCFIHQLPRGLRKSLYIKDEDYRLSFLSGNFVTFSDVTDKELERIVRYKLSPLYVSIHTVDNDLRRRMLGNPHARDILEVIEVLVKSGIVIHGQVVLCPGMNDGEKLEETVRVLKGYFPGLQSVALVPVGLTKHRKNLPKIDPVTPVYAERIVKFVEGEARKNRVERGVDFLYASDEFYILSRARIPSMRRYGNFAQIENGVGILRGFMEGAKKFSKKKTECFPTTGGIVATGTLAHRYVREFLDEFNRRTGSKFEAVPVTNNLFGKSVTVTGLVSGRDVISETKKRRGENLFIPSVMLREGGDRFLDDVTPEDVEKETGKKVIIFEPDPLLFYGKVAELVVD